MFNWKRTDWARMKFSIAHTSFVHQYQSSRIPGCLSSKRIFVEHRIWSVKIFRVTQERFRLNPHKYEQVILTICGLVRLRIRALILPLEISVISSG